VLPSNKQFKILSGAMIYIDFKMMFFFVLFITEGLLQVFDGKNINKINRNLNLVCTKEVRIKTSIHSIFLNKRIKNKR